MALTGLLQISVFLNIESLQIYGDSKIIMDHVNAKISIENHYLSRWMNRIESLWSSKKDFAIKHVNRSQHTQADELSNKGLQSQVGKWEMTIAVGELRYHIQDFDLPGT